MAFSVAWSKYVGGGVPAAEWLTGLGPHGAWRQIEARSVWHRVFQRPRRWSAPWTDSNLLNHLFLLRFMYHERWHKPRCSARSPPLLSSPLLSSPLFNSSSPPILPTMPFLWPSLSFLFSFLFFWKDWKSNFIGFALEWFYFSRRRKS